MNPHATCGTCIFNEDARCTCEAGRYKGCAVKSWNTCAAHKAPAPSTAELIERLATCAAGLDWREEKAAGEYKAYFADRARQCRSWLADLRAGHRIGDEDIIGGLIEFESLAL